MEVEVSYKIEGMIGRSSERDNDIEELAKLYGGFSIHSGSGFDYRDLGFEFPLGSQGEAFVREARSKGLIE